MPQIWMTYDEIGGLLDCAAEEARRLVRLQRLDRKRSGDGKTRVKLGPELTARFLARIRTAHDVLDRAIQDLLDMREVMGRDTRDQDSAVESEPRRIRG
jgi:hypothetical protein